jgi:hypothetical protein
MRKQDNVLAEFRQRVVMTLVDFMELDNWSSATVHRYLKKWEALNSFNYNGRYYVLRYVPRFDEFGLWNYEGIRFSRFGNLTETIIGLIENSGSGMLASELSVLLGNEVHPFLARILAKGCLTRLKQRGGHIYFSSTPGVREAQEKSLLDKKCSVAAQLSLEKAVAILIEKIKNPELEAYGLAALLRSRGIALREQDVYGFLCLHGLAKKK